MKPEREGTVFDVGGCGLLWAAVVGCGRMWSDVDVRVDIGHLTH